jgi:hypothetical protein
LKFRNTFGKKKINKIEEKAETIKIFKVSSLKNILNFCDDKFFVIKLYKIISFKLKVWDFYLFLL